MKRFKETFILSFALFAMFFGAGNVILPSFIGARVGEHLWLASFGFVLTGVGLPLLGLLIVIKNKGDYISLFEPMGKWFFRIFLVLAFLSIGPIIAIPRTAATTFEMGVLPIFPSANGLVVTIIFFIICVIFSINENKVVEEVGKILTPLLLITLIILIVVGVLNNDTITNKVVVDNTFTFSFLEGYNTLDAIASIIFARFIYISVKDKKDPMKLSINASIIAAISLTLVYLGIIYLGNTVNISNPLDYSRIGYIIKITEVLLGSSAKIVLGLIISLACLTTAIGLIASVSDFFETLFKGKLKYSYIVIIISLVSFIISQLKVDRIISLAFPILMVFYPVLIVIMILTLLKSKFINNLVISSVTYTALTIAIIEQLSIYTEKKVIYMEQVNRYVGMLPFSNFGMAWLIPCLMVFVISLMYNFMRSSYGK